jgi:NADP-dependent 3-hydroxy acid dehydrogenase YdfG
MQANTTPRVVVVTGASAGVGRAIARAFGKRGAHIGLLARGHAGLEAAKREVEEVGGKAVVIPTDVADPEQVEAAASKVEETFGPIDIWVNVAMATVFGEFKEIKSEDFKRVTEVTYLGQVYGTMAALHRMLPRDKGHIIQIGSALAYRGIPLQSAYCGAKHAIQGFTESVRCELIHDKSKVKITMVQLPAVNTTQFSWVKSHLPHKAQPVPPIYQPEVIADAVTWVADHYRRQLFVGGSTVIVIQGNKVAPGLGDRYLAKTGYKSQQTDQPEDPNRPDNLWKPLDEEQDHGAHGEFDSKARDKSWQLMADTHRGLLALAASGIAGLFVGVLFWRKLAS